MIGMHLIGVLSRGVLTEIDGSTDKVMPVLIATYMNPVLAGITITGPLAATMSTISSLLISGSSAVVKDIYLHHLKKENKTINQKTVGKISVAVTAVMGIAAVLLSINPPHIIGFDLLLNLLNMIPSGTFLAQSEQDRSNILHNRRSFIILCYNCTGNKNRCFPQHSNRHRCWLYMFCYRQYAGKTC